jgi:PAS domain S-box-containing protein
MDPVRKAKQPQQENRPEDLHKIKMQTQLRRLERQDWWLWGLAFALLLLLTLAVASFSLPGLLGQADPFWQFHQRLAASALLGLVLLFVVYTGYLQYRVRQVRRRLAEQVSETDQEKLERRRAEELLCLSEDKFSKAFHLNPTAMAISTLAEEHYLEVNDAFLKMVGYEKYELLGRTSMQLDIWVNPAHRSKLLVALQEKQRLDDEEFLFRTRKGDVRYGRLSAQMIQLAGEKCLLSAVRDCTEQRLVEEAAREGGERYRRSEEELRTLVDNAPCGIYRSSPETGRFVAVNPALVRMLGYASAEQVLTLDLARDVYCVPEDHARVAEAWRGREHFQTLELRWKRKTGGELLVRVSGRAARGEGGKEYLEVIAEDITEQRVLEY